MNCTFCNSKEEGRFCSNCGKKILVGFSEENFAEVQAHVWENPRSFISNSFSEEIKINPPYEIKTIDGIYKTFKKYGYLFRVVEEKFGNFEKNFDEVLKNKTLAEATDFFDKNLPINSISISGIDKKYFVDERVVPLFEQYIEKNCDLVTEQILNNKVYHHIDTKKLSENLAYFKEMLYRNATWGYLYKLLENGVS